MGSSGRLRSLTVAVATALALLALSREASAQSADASRDNPYFPVHATRRHGFVFGGVAGLQLVEASGTPTAYTERGDAFRAGTGVTAVPLAGTLFLGGAFTDWFSFHVGATASRFSRNDMTLTEAVFVMRIETWPLYPLGGVFRDIGLGGEFGTGASSLSRQSTGEKLADGGGLSLLGANVFWDAARLGGLNVGPYLAYLHGSSETYEQHTVWLGLRTVFYTGP